MDKFEALNKYFGFSEFREGQEEIIDHITKGENVMAVLPTGAGKSLCFQLPALISPQFSIVISPLIALMKDQVDSLNKLNRIAAFINSSMDYSEIDSVIREIAEKKIKLLYIAPERLENLSFAERIKQFKVDFLFVDEAHCISEWGHSFRPSYRKISLFADLLNIKKISAFTATATPEVVKDIISQLKIVNPKIVLAGFKRQNLFISVIPTKAKKEKTLELIRRHGSPAIVYTSSRKKAEEIYEFLAMNRISCTYYHAGLSSIERKIVQDDFINSKKDVIIATNAFGMGIDKKNIRVVIHYNMPGTIENYYQEIGRAGRDGLDSFTFLLFDNSDINIQQYLINSSYPDRELVLGVYNAVCDYGGISIGSTGNKQIPINKDYLSSYLRRDLSAGLIFSTFKLLQEAGYLKLLSGLERSTKFRFLMTPEHIKRIVTSAKDKFKAEFLLHLVRKFGAKAFNDVAFLSIPELSRDFGLDESEIDFLMTSFHDSGIIEYEKPLLQESIQLVLPRVESSRFAFDFNKLNKAYAIARQKLEIITGYIFTKQCRAAFILNYFSDKEKNYKCGKCDNCGSSRNISPVLEEYLYETILSTLYDNPDGFTEGNLVNLLNGKTKSIKLRQVSTFNNCSNYSVFELTSIVKELIDNGFIKQNIYRKNKLQLTNKGNNFLKERGLTDKKIEEEDYEKNIELLFILKELRKSASGKYGQSEYIICPEEVLSEIVIKKPTSKAAIMGIAGFNERMYNKIGDDFVKTINSFLDKYSKTNDNDLDFSVTAGGIPANLSETLHLIKKGYSLSEIAKTRKIDEAVISLQVETILEVIPNLDLSRLIDNNSFIKIQSEYKKGNKQMKDIKKVFPELSYAEIRVILSSLKANRTINI